MPLLSENFSFIFADITNYKLLEKIIRKEKFDVIFHCAAQTSIKKSFDDPYIDFKINAQGTLHLLNAITKLKREDRPILIHCSTSKIYGDRVDRTLLIETNKKYFYKDGIGISEDFNYDTVIRTPYGCSKLSADLYVQDCMLRDEINAGIFRLGYIYGERDYKGMINRLIYSNLNEKEITIFGNGKQTQDLLYVSDLIGAFDRFLKKETKKGNIYNLGGGYNNTVSILELIELIEKKTGKKTKISYKDWRFYDQKVYISDISRIQRDLDWYPKVTVEKGITNLIRTEEKRR